MQEEGFIMLIKMTQFKHTPAPISGSQLLKRLLERKEEKNENGQFVVINNIQNFSGTTYIRYDAIVFELNKMLEENKLSAAAPELLESLIECLEGVKELNGEYQDGWDDVIERAEQVIQRLAEQTN